MARLFHGSPAVIAAATVTIATLVSLGSIHLFMLRTLGPLSMDEGYMGGLATRFLISGMRPGLDAISQRGPVLYWLVAIAQGAFGTYSWVGMRVLAWAVPTVTVFGCLGIGAAGGRPLAGALGGATFVAALLLALAPDAGIALNGEHVSGMFTVLATWRVARGLGNRGTTMRKALSVASGGALAALAGLAKQVAFPCLLPLLLWTILNDQIRPETGRRRLAMTTALAIGWAAPLALVFGFYLSTGRFSDFFYFFYTYNAKIFLAPFHDVSFQTVVLRWFGENQVPVTVLAFVAGSSLAGLLGRAGGLAPAQLAAALEDSALEWVSLTQLACAFAGALVQMKLWGHQTVSMLPWLGLLVGVRTERVLEGGPPFGRRLAGLATAAVSAILLLVASQTLLTRFRAERDRGQWTGPSDAICVALDRYTRKDDALYVWGFDGDIYVTCQRRPASRFVYTTMPAGIVVPFWNQPRPERVARRSREMTRIDLETSRPTAMLDLSFRFGGFSMWRVPEIAGYMTRVGYCDLGDVEGKFGRRGRLWIRRGVSGCPAPTR